MIQFVERSASDEPSFLPTPMTWHGTLFQRISFPTGSTPGRRFFDEIHSDGADRGGAGEVGVGDVAAFDEVYVVEFRHL